jgi:hypothetical protein
LLVFTTKEDTEVDKTTTRNRVRAVTDPGVRVRQMDDADLELRSASAPRKDSPCGVL